MPSKYMRLVPIEDAMISDDNGVIIYSENRSETIILNETAFFILRECENASFDDILGRLCSAISDMNTITIEVVQNDLTAILAQMIEQGIIELQ